MKENKRKWKEAGTVERFPPNFINEQKDRSHLQYVQMTYIKPKTRKITKIHELPLLHIDKRVKKVKSAGNVNSGRNLNSGCRKVSFATLRNFATCEILQVAKISQPYKIPVVLHFFSLFVLLSF